VLRAPPIFPRPGVSHGHKCDRCGALSVPKLSVVLVGAGGDVVATKMRLCPACADAMLDQDTTITSVFGTPIQRRPPYIEIRERITEEHLSGAERNRAEQVLVRVANSAFEKTFDALPEGRWPQGVRERAIKLFEVAVARQCNILIRAATVKPDVHLALANVKAACDATRRTAREKLANDLRDARRKLQH
jgi:hypothetical protein